MKNCSVWELCFVWKLQQTHNRGFQSGNQSSQQLQPIRMSQSQSSSQLQPIRMSQYCKWTKEANYIDLNAEIRLTSLCIPPMTSPQLVQFSSRWPLCVEKCPHAFHPVSRDSTQYHTVARLKICEEGGGAQPPNVQQFWDVCGVMWGQTHSSFLLAQQVSPWNVTRGICCVIWQQFLKYTPWFLFVPWYLGRSVICLFLTNGVLFFTNSVLFLTNGVLNSPR